ncbi:MAG: nucleoside deaminase [Sneathiella sp.]|nr:nucleoside deaminase [Sneathiella sp.]
MVPFKPPRLLTQAYKVKLKIKLLYVFLLDVVACSRHFEKMDFELVNYMEYALHSAEIAGNRGEVPVGAVVVDSKTGRIVATNGNQMLGRHDPTAHAEMLAIRAATNMVGSQRLVDCDLYVTLEPCPMCAAAISLARIRRLYFGAFDPKGGGVEHGPRIYDHSTCNHKPEVYGGIGEKAAAELLKSFFVSRR